MTAEILVMNRDSIALAADSAVTITANGNSRKIFTSANKLFALSQYYPIGIMVYGSATFLGISWETIIKIYRNNLAGQNFDTLEEFGKHFFYFIENTPEIFLEIYQENCYLSNIQSFFDYLIDESMANFKSKNNLSKDSDIKDMNGFIQYLSDNIDYHHNKWNCAGFCIDMDDSFQDSLREKYSNEYLNILQKNKIFCILCKFQEIQDKLVDIAICIGCKNARHVIKGDRTGIVITGFGKNDVFPKMISYDIEMMVFNKVKYLKSEKCVNFNSQGIIEFFAQSDPAKTYVNGIDSSYFAIFSGFLNKIAKEIPDIILKKTDLLDDSTREKLKEEIIPVLQKRFSELPALIENYSKEKFSQPIYEIITLSPKEELAIIAESLVHLSSLKKKFSTELDTVGGPIDVAVITKGDGFIWIKRKHYFDPAMNPMYFNKLSGGAK